MPFRLRRRASPGEDPVQRPAREQWRSAVGAQPLVSRAAPSTVGSRAFVRTLPTRWRTPAVLRPLAHDLAATPAGRLAGTGITADPLRAADSELPVPATGRALRPGRPVPSAPPVAPAPPVPRLLPVPSVVSVASEPTVRQAGVLAALQARSDKEAGEEPAADRDGPTPRTADDPALRPDSAADDPDGVPVMPPDVDQQPPAGPGRSASAGASQQRFSVPLVGAVPLPAVRPTPSRPAVGTAPLDRSADPGPTGSRLPAPGRQVPVDRSMSTRWPNGPATPPIRMSVGEDLIAAVTGRPEGRLPAVRGAAPGTPGRDRAFEAADDLRVSAAAPDGIAALDAMNATNAMNAMDTMNAMDNTVTPDVPGDDADVPGDHADVPVAADSAVAADSTVAMVAMVAMVVDNSIPDARGPSLPPGPGPGFTRQSPARQGPPLQPPPPQQPPRQPPAVLQPPLRRAVPRTGRTAPAAPLAPTGPVPTGPVPTGAGPTGAVPTRVLPTDPTSTLSFSAAAPPLVRLRTEPSVQPLPEPPLPPRQSSPASPSLTPPPAPPSPPPRSAPPAPSGHRGMNTARDHADLDHLADQLYGRLRDRLTDDLLVHRDRAARLIDR